MIGFDLGLEEAWSGAGLADAVKRTSSVWGYKVEALPIAPC